MKDKVHMSNRDSVTVHLTVFLSIYHIGHECMLYQKGEQLPTPMLYACGRLCLLMYFM